ncbi:MAG: hypothetical protein CBC35_12305 [Planctomycetes bacterium TMED75]|nr:MAG: hypothetical protein CBC35_12305 [Planctomycetes bacterium TMED75]
MLPLAVVSGTSAFADVYTDGAFDQGPENGNLDLVSVTVTNDDTNLFFAIETREIADWTKYLAFIDTGDGGVDGNNNPWFRNIEMGAAGVDFFAGSWIDGGGGIDFQSYNGSGWQGAAGAGLSIDWAANTVTLSFELATLGVSGGDTIGFEIATSGTDNGNPATDLMNGNSGTWGGGSSFNEMLSYTVVPAPGAVSLLAVAGLIARRRRA